jgi:predicted dehydrogenase
VIKEKLKVAFLGGSVTSAIGRAHFNALNLDGEFELVAGCFSTSWERNQQSAAFFGVDNKKLYRSIEDLVSNNADYDAIILLTPTPNHASHLKEIWPAGKHVVSEKALVHSTIESDAIGRLYQLEDLSVIFNYTGYPMVREIRERIRSGLIGGLQQIIVEMPQEGFEKKDLNGEPLQPQSWRLTDFDIPTISLDLGVHLENMIYFLTNQRAQSVYASSQTFGNFNNVVDSQSALIRYENELIVNFWITKAALGERNGLKIRIYGSEGSMQWVQESPDTFFFADKYGIKRLIDRGDPSLLVANDFRYLRFKAGHPTGFIEALANYYNDIHKKILNDSRSNKQDYVFGWQEAHQGLVLMDAIKLSSSSHQEVIL